METWYELGGPENDVVVATCVRLNRNLREYPFPIRMSRADRAAVTERVLDAVENSSVGELYRLHYIDMEKLPRTEAVSLVERQLAGPEFISQPEGRGLLLSDDESVGILLNAENHLQLQVNAAGLDLDGTYRAVDGLDTLLDKSLHFAFDEDLGFLTQNPVNLGTGLCASLTLHLPALKENGGAARLSGSLSRLGLALRGADGTGSEPKGALYLLSNQVSLGLSEQEAISNLRNLAMQILVQERSAREELAENIEVQDAVSRSLGILQSARIMSNDEFMNLISNVRFGVSAGMIPGIGYGKIDRLSAEVQPATLLARSGKKLTANERRSLRAQKIKEALRD